MAKRSARSKRLQRIFVYPLEAVAAILMYTLFAILPMDAASAVGGWLARTIGPRLGITRRARTNMERALPDLDTTARDATLTAMWDNAGRTVAELPHLARIARSRIEIQGEGHILPFREDGKSCILFSGHFANWELLPQTVAHFGLPCVTVYRAANNPLVDAFLRWARRLDEDDLAPKGPRGARRALTALKQGRRLGMLIDQKMNDGIAVPFFGRDAMTAPAPAQLALRENCPMIPTRLERLGGCHFRVTFYAPLEAPAIGDRKQDVAVLMGAVNALFEEWITERPDQWLWLHRRWPDS